MAIDKLKVTSSILDNSNSSWRLRKSFDIYKRKKNIIENHINDEINNYSQDNDNKQSFAEVLDKSMKKK